MRRATSAGPTHSSSQWADGATDFEEDLRTAQALVRNGLPAQAEDICRTILRNDSRQPDALHLLGILLLERGLGVQATGLLRRAVDSSPGSARLHRDLGNCLRMQGDWEGARQSYEHAFAISPEPGLRVLMATLLPVIPQSSAEIVGARARLARELDILRTSTDVKLADPLREVGVTAFHLAYHGLSDRALQEQLASFYLEVCPELGWTAPHCLDASQPQVRDRRLRIGIVSTFFRYHTIAKVTRAMVERLRRDRFHITLFTLGPEDDWSQQIFDSADTVVRLSRELSEMRQCIADQELDVLHYPEIGMHPATYFLAFARLAPVQSVTWGHPVTTGIPAVDYYVSATNLEPEGSEIEYSERLVQLATLPTCYAHPPAPSIGVDRARFGIEEGMRLYACPQLLFKLHPDFDPILGDILRRDPAGILLFLEGAVGVESSRMQLFRDRFARANPDVEDRLVIRPFLGSQDFIDLLSVADVLLDPPYFGGGNTSLEAFSTGTPVVTWPGPFARGRTTFACYRRMDVDDGIVSRLDEYADRAVRIATDAGYRADIRRRILARKDVLYNDTRAIREFESFFERAVDEAWRNGGSGNGETWSHRSAAADVESIKGA